MPKLNQITVFIEKRLERNVQATFGAFRFLRVGGTHVQLHSQENEIYLTFSKSYSSRDSFFIMQFYFFTKTIDIKSALGIIMQIEKILLNIS